MKVKGFFPNPKAIYGFLTDKESDWKPKFALVLALIWIVSPLDGDWIPLIGWIDDAFLGMLAMWYVNHASNTWQDKQLEAAQSAKVMPRIVEGSGVTIGDELDATDVARVSPIPNSRKRT